MKKIDARTYACPRPVIMARKAIKEENLEKIEVLVDNEIATQNLSKMAKQLNFTSKIEKISESDFSVVLIKDNQVFQKTEEIHKEDPSSYIVAISSDQMGSGDEDFSKKLLEGFLYSLREQDSLPKYIIFYNKGVRLVSLNQKTIEDLKYMENQGVKILSCGLCLDNYNLKEKLEVGEITNMYRICELLRKYKTVSPC
ncbi:MAG: sulfurtransferase-like selenium metabolism protein YedF [Peptoniphilaceae bacterium]